MACFGTLHSQMFGKIIPFPSLYNQWISSYLLKILSTYPGILLIYPLLLSKSVSNSPTTVEDQRRGHYSQVEGSTTLSTPLPNIVTSNKTF